MKVSVLLILLFLGFRVCGQPADSALPGYISINTDTLHRQKELKEHWLFRGGDSIEWAKPEYNDSAWKAAATYEITAYENENVRLSHPGIMWFRYKFYIDSASLSRRTVGIKIYQSGASEIYLDGKKIQGFGTVSNNGHTLPYNPQNVPIALPILAPGNHVLAVRYSNDEIEKLSRYDEAPGFSMAMGYINDMSHTVYRNTLHSSLLITLLLGIFATLSIVHLFLYLYDRKVKANLYFSGFTFSMAVWFLGAYGTFLETNVARLVFSIDLTFIAMAAASFTLSGFSNTLFSTKKRRLYIIGAYCFICLMLWILVKTDAYPAYLLMMCIVLFEVMIVTTRAILRRIPGARIIGIGTSFFTLYLLATVVLIASGVHRNAINTIGFTIYIFLGFIAILSIPGSISIYLAWSFSRTSKDLAVQLVQVQTLSEKTREQELEKQRMLENRQQELEHEVDIRTSEILSQKDEIQTKHNELIIEKQKSDDLLRNILPEEVAEELKNKGTSEAKYFDHVSVIFTDFVNFTKAGEQMTPQQLVHELHTCFKAFDEISAKYNIEKIKTIGDAYLAVCGLPLADEDHAAQTIRAALEIQAFIANRKQQFPDTSFNIRIGVHSGSVVAGIVGVKKFAYDIWGDTVNTAARMEQSGESGKINISQSTYELIKDQFACTFRGEVTAKNKGQMNMYFVERAL